jgi:DNA-binding transcriptional regulator YhcF (GntR family)
MSEFLQHVSVDEWSATPKYRQLMNAVLQAVKLGVLKEGDSMPSINELSFHTDISRLTVEKSYKELRKAGVLEAYQGKGYFVKSTHILQEFRVLLMFNKLSAHKKIIYDAFAEALGDRASIDFFIYNNDARVFCKLLADKRKNNYTHFVIIPHFIDGEKAAVQALEDLPKSQLILLDKALPEVGGEYGAVYENFYRDIYQALFELLPSLQKYRVLKLVFPEGSYYPREIVDGFISFCESFVFEHKVVHEVKAEKVQRGEVYINLMEDDLFDLLELVEKQGLKIGEELGIISYNETKAKKYIVNGLTTVSTDFAHMGRKAAELVLQHSREQIENPFYVTVRESLS